MEGRKDGRMRGREGREEGEKEEGGDESNKKRIGEGRTEEMKKSQDQIPLYHCRWMQSTSPAWCS